MRGRPTWSRRDHEGDPADIDPLAMGVLIEASGDLRSDAMVTTIARSM